MGAGDTGLMGMPLSLTRAVPALVDAPRAPPGAPSGPRLLSSDSLARDGQGALVSLSMTRSAWTRP